MSGVALAVALTSACTIENPPRALPDLDRVYFDRAVQPVLARRCAFPDCHGSPDRFLSVYARGRYRFPLGVDAEGRPIGTMSPITRRELDLNFDRARGFVDPDEPEKSQLIQKPLAEEAGGLYHRAANLYRQRPKLDVFLSAEEPDYVTLLRWVFGGAPCEDSDGESSCEVPAEEVPTE